MSSPASLGLQFLPGIAQHLQCLKLDIGCRLSEAEPVCRLSGLTSLSLGLQTGREHALLPGITRLARLACLRLTSVHAGESASLATLSLYDQIVENDAFLEANGEDAFSAQVADHLSRLGSLPELRCLELSAVCMEALYWLKVGLWRDGMGLWRGRAGRGGAVGRGLCNVAMCPASQWPPNSAWVVGWMGGTACLVEGTLFPFALQHMCCSWCLPALVTFMVPSCSHRFPLIP